MIPINKENWHKNRRFKGDSTLGKKTETKIVLFDTIAAERMIFFNLTEGAARPAKHLAIKVASNVNRALEIAAVSLTADAIGNPTATEATVPSFTHLFTDTRDCIYEKHKKHKQV